MALCDDLEAKQTQKYSHLVKLGTGSLNALQQSTTEEELIRWWGHLQTNFGQIFDCVENVEALRQTILQLAVTGRLGTEDERDEPASELIRQIVEEKRHLIEFGVICRTKPVPEIDENDIPYTIPLSWKWVRLDDLTYISTGSTPSTTNPDYYQMGIIPWVTSSQTSLDYISIADKKITQKAVDDCALKIYPIGTLLVALYGQGKTRGQVSELKIDATINQACAAICFFDRSKLIKDFVKFVLKKNYHSIRSISAGGAQPNLNLDKIKRMLIPLPPLREQKRIVDKLNDFMLICDQLDQRIYNRERISLSFTNSIIRGIVN
ncbi:restriction endonuclease subunit S [Methanospirillum purgamenti]|jgi:type I restriction enzyme S subunit|uniref:Restriction endonuclease subunit S n=1 Tax=Methanospirillum hungatei TaxID=2203 RepID=A0A8F5ZH84_METHU|nr:restriction endonuclease subunit S [Methanospirillum hungatei]QXO95549.1 restriction endonuclease subunit S [Methanospirillum hungatei]